MLAGVTGAWRPFSELEKAHAVSRSSRGEAESFRSAAGSESTPPLDRQRFVLAKLEIDQTLLDERDRDVRADILATVDPAMVLNALVRGLAHVGVRILVEGQHRAKE